MVGADYTVKSSGGAIHVDYFLGSGPVSADWQVPVDCRFCRDRIGSCGGPERVPVRAIPPDHSTPAACPIMANCVAGNCKFIFMSSSIGEPGMDAGTCRRSLRRSRIPCACNTPKPRSRSAARFASRRIAFEQVVENRDDGLDLRKLPRELLS
jgi:hypothetical protein